MTRYLDGEGLDYFYQKLKGQFATIEQVVDEFMASYAYFYKLDESTYTTTGASETTIPVGISGFRATDVLFVEVSGLALIKGTDYTISGTSITLATPITHAGTVVHFVALRAAAATASDYSALKGDDGAGVPTGGTTGQMLAKVSNADNDTQWIDPTSVLQAAYPIGSIYLNASNGTNPATLLGFGTWERLGQGRMMIDADSTYTAGGTGGSATHDHGGKAGSTTLTAAQSGLPAHTHGFTNPKIPNHVHSMTHHHTYEYAGDAASNISGSNPDNMGNVIRRRTDGSKTGLSTADYTGNTGNPTSLDATTGGAVGAVTGGAKAASSGHDHTISSANNMPPWIGVYMWQRTA